MLKSKITNEIDSKALNKEDMNLAGVVSDLPFTVSSCTYEETTGGYNPLEKDE